MQAPGETRAGTLETYLAVLDAEIAGPRKRRRELLTEIRAHLEDMIAEIRDGALDRAVAEREAIERFGNPRDVAARLRTTGTLIYEEGVRSLCIGALVFCVIWVMPGPAPLSGLLPLLTAAFGYPVGLVLRLWERHRHVRGEHVSWLLGAVNGSTAGYALRVAAALAGITVFFAPLVEYAQLGWAVATVLGLAVTGWVVYTVTRPPRANALLSRRRVAGVMAGIAGTAELGRDLNGIVP